ncbi:oxidoreductase [Rosettibacter firmus]|uniref:NADH-quinone oxidoreductase subunit B family protein n=1 Tax=Rosettibacter firmus TaxID=3111522 RepID=UPI00336BC73E
MKPKLALYWAASCGGCEITILDIEEKILDVAEFFDIVFWPCAMDFKYSDVEAMEDGTIDLTLFNGAIRNDENEHIAKLLRKKSKLLVAFGSCAMEGCIPGLANLFDRNEIFDFVFKDSPSVDEQSKGIFPQLKTEHPEGETELPEFWNNVKTLKDVVDVDYFIPGCPPQSFQVTAVILAVIDILKTGKELPPKGTVLGTDNKTCCDECPRTRKEKKIKEFYRPHEIIPDENECLLDQGILCMGPATRSGCGALCVKANVPCRGCYGPPPNVRDQGAKMISALSSVIDATSTDEIRKIFEKLVDPIGTLYRFSLAGSTLKRKHFDYNH